MVAIKQSDTNLIRRRRHSNNHRCIVQWICFVTILLVLVMLFWVIGGVWTYSFETEEIEAASKPKQISSTPGAVPPNSENNNEDEGAEDDDSVVNVSACPVRSTASLSNDELHPTAGSRHMITPPDGGQATLVCCSTTKGHMSILVHEKWAPIGVARFLDMVRSQYFDSKIPLFRCSDACQFGLAGKPELTKHYDKQLQDDPNWMPPGQEHRENSNGVRRYPSGFLIYAGAGPNSRTNQFVLTIQPNQFMGGGSPWEVPLGELVGHESFETLNKLYTGYGHKNAPGQPLLRREGYSEHVQKEWPLMDLITGCLVVDELHLDS